MFLGLSVTFSLQTTRKWDNLTKPTLHDLQLCGLNVINTLKTVCRMTWPIQSVLLPAELTRVVQLCKSLLLLVSNLTLLQLLQHVNLSSSSVLITQQEPVTAVHSTLSCLHWHYCLVRIICWIEGHICSKTDAGTGQAQFCSYYWMYSRADDEIYFNEPLQSYYNTISKVDKFLSSYIPTLTSKIICFSSK